MRLSIYNLFLQILIFDWTYFPFVFDHLISLPMCVRVCTIEDFLTLYWLYPMVEEAKYLNNYTCLMINISKLHVLFLCNLFLSYVLFCNRITFFFLTFSLFLEKWLYYVAARTSFMCCSLVSQLMEQVVMKLFLKAYFYSVLLLRW